MARPLELLHVDLMGPIRTESLKGKKQNMVVVDDLLDSLRSSCCDLSLKLFITLSHCVKGCIMKKD